MNFTLSIRKEAEADITEAYRYYENARPGLGTEFIQCVDDAIHRIQNNPRQYKQILGTVRRVFVRKFLYGVYYTLNDSQIVVIAVVHARKNPKHWQQRS